MGFCYITGKKVGPKRWKFLKCDGRTWNCPQDNQPMNGKSSVVCVEWCKTYKQCVQAIEDWYKIHPDEEV